MRRRRRDLALLKALGFAPGQLARAIAWQATIAAVIGIVIGIPLGIISGRLLWESFAGTLYAVPDPTVPILSVVLVGVGALVFRQPCRRVARPQRGANPDREFARRGVRDLFSCPTASPPTVLIDLFPARRWRSNDVASRFGSPTLFIEHPILALLEACALRAGC